jgi:hypothetical protein
MTLNDKIKSDVPGIFLSTSDFAEPIMYYSQVASDCVAINAIVDREPPAFYNASGEAVLADIQIIIHNNGTTGVLAEDVDINNDYVRMSRRRDGTEPENFSVMQITRHDEGVVVLALKG